MEPITRVATMSHFLLMFGYKLFSFFFPLYLVQQGFSLPQVGYTYLLIYLPIALFAPIAGYLNKKLPPVALTITGIVGYAAYSLVMLFTPTPLVFYTMQIILGLAAACFFISTRSLLIGSHLRHPDQSFGFFYAAPNMAEALAPAAGAVLIFFLGFPGVFMASFLVYLMNLIYLATRRSVIQHSAVRHIVPTTTAYLKFGRAILKPNIFPLFLISFAVLLIGGIYQPFFVIFLDYVGWSQTQILTYGAVFSLLFVPISYLIIRFALHQRSSHNIYFGSLVFAVGSTLFGVLAQQLQFTGVLALALIRGAGSLTTNAGRSGYLARLFRKLIEPASVFDTVLSPLGVALGALLGGWLLTYLDFASLFTHAGIFIVLLVCGLMFFQRRFKV